MTRHSGVAALAAVAVAAFWISGCTETQFPEATGKGTVRGINAVEGVSDVVFLIEETPLGTLAFKESSSRAEYDNLNYTFNFDLPLPGAAPRRLASRNVDVVTDNDYLFVLGGDANSQQVLLWERPLREWTDADTTFDIDIGHASSLGAVDVYFDAPGTLPVAGNQIGTLSFGERLDAIEREAGDFELVVTAANDPSTVLNQGIAFNFAPAQSYTLAVFDGDPGITAPVSVRVVGEGGATVEIADQRFPPTAQFVHASFDTGPVDVVFDGDFANPAVGNLEFGRVSGDVDLPATTTNIQYAPTGNTTPLLEEETTVAAGSRSLFVLVGAPGDLIAVRLPSVRRSFPTVARLRLINALTNTEVIDIYVTEPGADISNRIPAVPGVALGFSTLGSQAAGDYEITVTANRETTPLVGPVPITLSAGDITEIVVLDTADPAAAELLIFSSVDP